MSLILVAALLTGSPAEPASLTPTEAASVMAEGLTTGSLIFSRGDCLAVRIYTVSPYTHVGVVVCDDETFVYDTTGRSGVRKQTLRDYLASQDDAMVHLFQPRNEFSDDQVTRLREHLESQFGRPYSIKHHLTGKPATGMHCAEYATEGLIAASVVQTPNPSRVSPASLLTGIVKSELYDHATTVRLVPEPAPQPVPATWCGRLWLDTKLCTTNCCQKLTGWFCCK